MEGWSESESYFVSTQNHSLWLLDQYVFKQPEIIFIIQLPLSFDNAQIKACIGLS